MDQITISKREYEVLLEYQKLAEYYIDITRCEYGHLKNDLFGCLFCSEEQQEGD